MPKKRYNKYLDDRGFSEESPKDEYIFDRSWKINPTRGKRNRRYEPTPFEFLFRTRRKPQRGA